MMRRRAESLEPYQDSWVRPTAERLYLNETIWRSRVRKKVEMSIAWDEFAKGKRFPLTIAQYRLTNLLGSIADELPRDYITEVLLAKNRRCQGPDHAGNMPAFVPAGRTIDKNVKGVSATRFLDLIR